MMNLICEGRLDLARLALAAQKPRLHEKGTHPLWQDEHISRHMLEAHLSQEHDAASRRAAAVDHTVAWLLGSHIPEGARVLDLGCGPGLYAERMARAGCCVTGVDFSQRSVAYARESSAKQGLAIDYRCADYLSLDYSSQFDAAVCICCDVGALTDEERGRFLHIVHRALKPGGTLVFDAFNERYVDRKPCVRGYDLYESGFWHGSPHMVLSETFHYPEAHTTCDQHVVVTETGEVRVYRTYDHYYSRDELTRVLEEARFTVKGFDGHVLDCIGVEDVLFTAAIRT